MPIPLKALIENMKEDNERLSQFLSSFSCINDEDNCPYTRWNDTDGTNDPQNPITGFRSYSLVRKTSFLNALLLKGISG